MRKEKEEEDERKRKEEQRLREKISNISDDYYEPPVYHRRKTFNTPSFNIPIYRHEFSGGRGEINISGQCNIF